MAFRAKWSAEQKRAILSAVFDHNWTVKEVHLAANNGQLPGIGAELEPFPIPLSTVQDLATRERHQRRGIKALGRAPETTIEEQCGRLMALAERHLTRCERRDSRKSLSTEDLAKLAKAMREVHTTARMLADRANGKAKANGKTTEEPAAQAESFVDQLASEVDR